jgi:hypothetical protein
MEEHLSSFLVAQSGGDAPPSATYYYRIDEDTNIG